MDPQIFRGAVLNAAIQGKFVPQDPNDEPASVLLERVREEKQRLIKEGKIKKDKNESRIYRKDGKWFESIGKEEKEIEVPFEIPDRWAWACVKNIVSKLVDGDHNPPKGLSERTEYCMISGQNIHSGTIDYDLPVRYLSKDIFDEENKRTLLEQGDILVTTVGTIGRCCIFDGQVKTCMQRSVTVMTSLIFNKYLKLWIESPFVQNFMNNNASGTAQKGFYLEKMEQLMVPIPPLNEQKRIVDYVSQLLKISDGHVELIERTNHHFDIIKKLCLNLAIQGKLVPQDPNDEPASVLLERVREEKQRLIKEGKIKKDKNESRIYRKDGKWFESIGKEEKEIEVPFEIPDSWTFTRVSNIASFKNGISSRGVESGISVPVIRLADLSKGYVDYTSIRNLNFNKLPDDDFFCKNNDILLIRVNGSKSKVGKAYIFSNCKSTCYCDHIICMCPAVNLFSEYIVMAMNSDCVFEQVSKLIVTTAGQNTISQSNIRSVIIPVPPLNEQKRIVEQINKIMQVIQTVNLERL